tara:strand:+ start:345 stop:560 length:216 start_codon:yes stop_codon:yes gene_type:complete
VGREKISNSPNLNKDLIGLLSISELYLYKSYIRKQINIIPNLSETMSIFKKVKPIIINETKNKDGILSNKT